MIKYILIIEKSVIQMQVPRFILVSLFVGLFFGIFLAFGLLSMQYGKSLLEEEGVCVITKCYNTSSRVYCVNYAPEIVSYDSSGSSCSNRLTS